MINKGRPSDLNQQQTTSNNNNNDDKDKVMMIQNEQHQVEQQELALSPISASTKQQAAGNSARKSSLQNRPALYRNPMIEHQLASSMSVVSSSSKNQLVQQARPLLRPNQLRRQGVIGAPDLGAPTTAAGTLIPGPAPRRPTKLPASYANLMAGNRYLNQAPIVGALSAKLDNSATGQGGGSRAIPMPNRYAWAAFQKHGPPDSSSYPWTHNNYDHDLHHQNSSSPRLVSRRDSTQQRADPNNKFQYHFSSPFSSAASRVLVVNPMQIVNLSEHTKSRLIKLIEALKRFSEKWFSHVLLLMFLAVYACLGAYVFISFEASNEQDERRIMAELKAKFINSTWQEAQNRSVESFIDYYKSRLEEHERLINRAGGCNSGGISSTNSNTNNLNAENQWTFWGALFYSMTVFTTIGYGHLTPITFAGRVATMVYAIFGIPILLMVLADLGKLLTRIIKFTFKQFRTFYNKCMNRKSSLRTRKLISDNTSQYFGVARDALERGVPGFTRVIRAGRNKNTNSAHQILHHHGSQLLVIGTSNESLAGQPPISAPFNGRPLEIDPRLTELSLELAKRAPDESMVASDVIVTPIKQTKPVSPPVNTNHKHPMKHHNHHRQNPLSLASACPPTSSMNYHPQQTSTNHSSSSSSSNNNIQKTTQQNQKQRKISNISNKSISNKQNVKSNSLSPSSSSNKVVSNSSQVNQNHQKKGIKDKQQQRDSTSDKPTALHNIQMTPDPSSAKTELDKPVLVPETGACVAEGAAVMGTYELITGGDIVASERVHLHLAEQKQRDQQIENAPKNQHQIQETETNLDNNNFEQVESLEEQHETVIGDEILDGEDVEEQLYEVEEQEEEEEDLDIPVSFALFLLVTYMMFGAVVFSIWEGWNFFESLYFVFISMSTIGFGDLVPKHPKRMIGTFIYLLFGLALTSMCINVVQEKIHATFLRAKMQIGEKMGLDLDQIMADDYYDEGGIPDEFDDAIETEELTNATAPNNNFSDSNSAADHASPARVSMVKQSASTGEVAQSNNKLSRNTPTLRSSKKQRSVASLPGHGNQSCSLRRKVSNKQKSARTPTSPTSSAPGSPIEVANPALKFILSPVKTSTQNEAPQQMESPTRDSIPTPNVIAPTPSSPENHQMSPWGQLAKSPKLETQTEQQHESSPWASSDSACNDPAKNEKNMVRAQLSGGPAVESSSWSSSTKRPTSPRTKLLISSRSQPTVVESLAHGQMSNQVYGTTNAPYHHQGGRACSASSSRRGSVSQELNQLDELISTLKAQSVSGRFAPLLGIPRRASARSSGASSPTNTRRAYSTISRSSRSPASGVGAISTSGRYSVSPRPQHATFYDLTGGCEDRESSTKQRAMPLVQFLQGTSSRDQIIRSTLPSSSASATLGQAGYSTLDARANKVKQQPTSNKNPNNNHIELDPRAKLEEAINAIQSSIM